MYTFFIAEAVQETTETVSSELLAEAVGNSCQGYPDLFAEAVQTYCRSRSNPFKQIAEAVHRFVGFCQLKQFWIFHAL